MTRQRHRTMAARKCAQQLCFCRCHVMWGRCRLAFDQQRGRPESSRRFSQQLRDAAPEAGWRELLTRGTNVLNRRLVDALHTLCFGLRPQIGFAFAEGKRVKPLRVRPHKPKAEGVVAKRGRAGVVAPRNAGVRCGEEPRATTDHPDRACRWTNWISRRQGFIVPLIPVPHPLQHVSAQIVQPSSVPGLCLHRVRRAS